MEIKQNDNVIFYDARNDGPMTALGDVILEAAKHLTNQVSVELAERMAGIIYDAETLEEKVSVFMRAVGLFEIEGHSLDYSSDDPGVFTLTLDAFEPMSLTLRVLTREDGKVAVRCYYNDGTVIDYFVALSDEAYETLSEMGEIPEEAYRNTPGGYFDELRDALVDAVQAHNLEVQ